MICWYILILVDDILIHVDIILYLKRLDRIALAAGQEPQFSERIFRKNVILPTYSIVPASGIARRDPPRHVDVIIQILIKIRLM